MSITVELDELKKYQSDCGVHLAKAVDIIDRWYGFKLRSGGIEFCDGAYEKLKAELDEHMRKSPKIVPNA